MIALEELLKLVPNDLLEKLACTYQVDKANQVHLTGPLLFVCLLNGLLNHPELSQRLLEETYRQKTGRSIDHSTFGKCLAKTNPCFFGDIFQYVYHSLEPGITRGTQQALRLRFLDATTVTLSAKLLQFGIKNNTRQPEKARRHVKSVLELSEEGLPNFLHLCKKQSEASDSVALGETMLKHTEEADFWIFDKGCHCRTRLLKLHQKGAFWLTPLSTQHFQTERVVWQAKQIEAPITRPEREQSDWIMTEIHVGLFANSQPSRNKDLASMPLVLVKGWRYDTRRASWKPFALITNLPLKEAGVPGVVQSIHIGPYTPEELAQLYRLRWQIELLFKFLKQHLSYSHLISRSENGIRSLIYMSLITALLMIWYRKLSGIDRGWRSVKFWLAENARLWTEQILATLPIQETFSAVSVPP